MTTMTSTKKIVGMPTATLLRTVENNDKPEIEHFFQKQVLDANHEKLIEMLTAQPALMAITRKTH